MTTRKSSARTKKTAKATSTPRYDNFRVGVIAAIAALGTIEAVSIPLIIQAFVKTETPALETPVTGNVVKESNEENAAAVTEEVNAAATSSSKSKKSTKSAVQKASTRTTTAKSAAKKTTTKKSSKKTNSAPSNDYLEFGNQPGYKPGSTADNDPADEPDEY